MNSEKKRPTNSQIAGIIWLSIALLIAGGALFFSRSTKADIAVNDSTAASEYQKLAQKEDSAYHARHKWQQSNRKSSTYQYRNSTYHPTADCSADTMSANTYSAAMHRQPLSVELNSADSVTLQLLHGIGPAYARRIVRYRERLGGFISTDQLLEVYGFTPELLDHIRPHLTLDTTLINHIDINTIELKQLIRHPYIEYYQARDIVTLRNGGTRFRNVDDLRAVPSMADSTLSRLLPYIDFGLPPQEIIFAN